MSDQPAPLSPKERVTMSDGENLLRMISKGPAVNKPILGPDGKPIAGESVAEHDYAKEAKDTAIKRIDELHKKLSSMANVKDDVNYDSEVVDICAVLLACYRLVFWAKVELFSKVDADSEFVEFVERFMRESVYNGAPFKVQQAIAGMRNNALPIVEGFMRKADMHKKKRMGKISAVFKRIQKAGGIALPVKAASGLFEKGFTLGSLLILRGSADAVSLATRLCASHASEAGHGKVYYLSTQTTNLGDSADVTMPLTWWKDACRSMHSLLEVLDPMVQDSAPLLVVEDLNQLYVSDKDKGLSVDRAKGLTIQRLYQWCSEQGAAVIAGDVVGSEQLDVRVYGPLPNLPVALTGPADRLILKFGAEDYPLPEVKKCLDLPS